MLKRGSCIVLFSVAVLLFAVGFSTIALSGSTNCISCHSGIQPSGGFTFVPPVFSFSFPQSVNPNSTFSAALSLVGPSKFEVLDAVAAVTISGQGGLSEGEQSHKSLVAVGGTSSVKWSLKAMGSNGTIHVAFQLNYTAHRSHTVSQGYDDFPYSVNSSYQIAVKTAAVQISKSQIAFVAGQQGTDTFDVVAETRIRNITIEYSSNLNGLVVLNSSGNVGTIEAGERLTVSVIFYGNQSVVDNGRINLVWFDETGVVDSAFVSVIISENPGDTSVGESVLKWAGRITGLVSLGLLFSSLGLGLIKIGKERRIRVHCAISWFLLGLSLYHGVVLLVGPYSGVSLGNYVVLGYASALMMGASSINGLLEKWMTKMTDRKTWIWMHRVFLTVAIILAVTHGILLGTDFAAIRSFLGG